MCVVCECVGRVFFVVVYLIFRNEVIASWRKQFSCILCFYLTAYSTSLHVGCTVCCVVRGTLISSLTWKHYFYVNGNIPLYKCDTFIWCVRRDMDTYILHKCLLSNFFIIGKLYRVVQYKNKWALITKTKFYWSMYYIYI